MNVSQNASTNSSNTSSKSTPPQAVLFNRGGLLESASRAYVCIVDSSGKVLYSLGDPDFVTYMRSSAKPLQALAVLLTGTAKKYNLSDSEISIISGSHGGEDIHVEAVSSILAKAGLDASYLQCGTHPPLDTDARRKMAVAGIDPTPIYHNCSGKHSGMLATARNLGESVKDYLNPDSPTQQRITGIIASMAGMDPSEIIIGIDGCSAPVHGLSMRASAFAFARLLHPAVLKPELSSAAQCVTRAMRAYPEMVSASKDRICTELIRAGRVFELTAKGGAEGFYSTAWRDSKTGLGIGMSVKVEDGSQRGRDPLVVALLQKFGVLPRQLGKALQQFAPGNILNNRGDVIGEVTVRI